MVVVNRPASYNFQITGFIKQETGISEGPSCGPTNEEEEIGDTIVQDVKVGRILGERLDQG